MSYIQKISLTQFRNYSYKVIDFDSRIVCITGKNGCGKTNLLDAIYYLCYTKSYFSSQQAQAVQLGTDGLRVEGVFTMDAATTTVVCKWQNGKKEVVANGQLYERVNDHIGKYAAVMIAPDDLELINEGSELRRKWVDSILCQVDKTYFEYLIRYQKVILQRNAWLKNEADKPTGQFYALEYYNQQLAESGDYMYHRRQMFTTQFLPLLTRYYSRLSGDQEQVQILYNSDLHECSLLQWLDNSLQHDLRLQRTARGVHKDDFIFLINEQPLRHFGSQGQKKSFLFALKLAQYEFIAKNLQQTPILLLDDVFEKLDQQRMESLIAIISDEHFGQVILTDTHAGRVAAAFHDGVAVQHLAIG